MKRRVRHHVNPLSYQGERPVPNWPALFANGQPPVEADLGTGTGAFLFGRAAVAPERNIVGLEIRKPVAEFVARQIAERGLGNAAVLRANAGTDLEHLFAPGSLERAYIHFPDPWFKRCHHKRRLVQPELLRALSVVMTLGGELHFATDYIAYATVVERLLARDPCFGPGCPAAPPFGVMSEREAWHRGRGDPVSRSVFKLLRRPPAAGEG